METLELDQSIFEAVARRRKRSIRLAELAAELDREAPAGVSTEESAVLEDLGSQANPASEKVAEHTIGDTIESVIDDVYLANLGSGKNDYGMLGELAPQMDLDAVPLTQPKRVLAKSAAASKEESSDDQAAEDSKPAKKAKRKNKPASLLDTYFKGL